MGKSFARLRIKDSQSILNFSKFSYVAVFFTDKGRVGTTKHQAIQANGLGAEVFFELKKDEDPKNTTVSFKVYLPSGTQYNPKNVIHGYTYTKEADSKPLITEYVFGLIQEKTEDQNKHRVSQRVIPITYPVPDGLRMVAYLRNEIKKAGAKYGVDAQIIASIVFEEKRYGIWAFRKNLLSYYLNFGELYPTNSYGFGEMQLGLAGDLMGIDKSNPTWIDEVFTIICTDATVAMELVAKNILRVHKILGRVTNLQESTMFYNGGEKVLNLWLQGRFTKEELKKLVATRSWNWQKAIKLALDGDVIAIPDDCEGNCRADPETITDVWKFDPSLKRHL